MSDDVMRYLDYYLNPTLETDFAVMLNGPWGSGKTHFIKAYFKARETKSTDSSKTSAQYLYASLNGVRSTSEITDQFFAQLHPTLNSKTFRLLGTIASRALNVILESDVNSSAENKEAIKSMMLNLDGRALVFDDLERSAMPLSEAMGFINAFVEHEKSKVIVVANESDIDEGQKSEYVRKKEKLIAKTLRATSAPEIVLDSFIDKLSNTKVQEIARQESAALLRTFKASGKLNFRSMRSVLWDYERLVAAVDKRLQDAPDSMTQLLLFMMATGLEFRSGDLSSDDLKALPVNGLARAMAEIGRKEKSSASLRLEKLEATYPDVVWDNPLVPPRLLASLFETGMIDAEIDNHLLSHPSIVGYGQTPFWLQLWRWDSLPHAQYLKAREGLISQLESRKLTHPGAILHAAGIVIGLGKYGDVLLPRAENVVAYFDRYVREIQSTGKLEPARDLFGHLGGSYGGYGYTERTAPEFIEIEKLVVELTQKAFTQRMKEVASGYLQKIRNNEVDYSSLHQYGVENGNYADAAFLHYINPQEFAQLIVRDSKPDTQLLVSLQARYESERHHQALVAEYPWIRSLRSHLEDIAGTLAPPHRLLFEHRIAHIFEKIDDAIGTA